MQMKVLAIAATTLALAGAGAGFAQTSVPQQQPESDLAEAARQAADSAATAAQDAKAAAQEAMQAAGDAISGVAHDAAAAAENAADTAAIQADKAEDTAREAAGDATTAAEHAADDAGDAIKEAADKAATAANDAANDAASAADDAFDSAHEATAAAEGLVVAPDVSAPPISQAQPGILGSWMTGRSIWTTHRPAGTEWADPDLAERPAEWEKIAKVDDVVLDGQGLIIGYLADIGGFLGIGAKTVLLGTDAIHLTRLGDEWLYATNLTKDELLALPDFDRSTLIQ